MKQWHQDTGYTQGRTVITDKEKLFSKLTTWIKFPGCSKVRRNPSRTRLFPLSWGAEPGSTKKWRGLEFAWLKSREQKAVQRENSRYPHWVTCEYTAKDCLGHSCEETIRDWEKYSPKELEETVIQSHIGQETVLILNTKNEKSQILQGPWLEY